MLIKVRGYKAIDRADILLDPIALVAGKNEQGKSSLAEAAAAVLTGTSIVVPDVNKKDAKVLVRDGADTGMAGVWVTPEEGTLGSRIIEWPKCTVANSEDAPFASRYAAGLSHPFDLNANDRAKWLGAYIDAMPSMTMLEAAMKDAGYGAPAIKQVSDAVNLVNGWESMYGKARAYSTKTKGQWEEVTGEAYGSKKAAEWKPAQYIDGVDHHNLKFNAESAAQHVLKTAGTVAVSAAEVERLRGLVAKKPPAVELVKEFGIEITRLRESLITKEAERTEMASPSRDKEQSPCPSCGTLLVVESWPKLSIVVTPPKKTATLGDRARLDTAIAKIRIQIASLEKGLGNAERAVDDGSDAESKLLEIGDNKSADATSVDIAQAAADAAKDALDAFESKQRADHLHELIEQNDKLITILAPDGLRRKALVFALGQFNAALASLADAAGWPAVRLDESLEPHYGTRPLWAASKSGKWRARAMIQILLAQLDDSAAVVLDEADILDAAGRNELFSLLTFAKVRALVCMTIGNREKVPDLKAAGIGASYWVSDGIVEAL